MVSVIERARLAALAMLSELPSRQSHVAGVAAVAEDVVARLGLSDRELLVAAAWLHDVGYAEPVARTGFHPVDGASWVRSQNFPTTVVSLVAYHTGAEVEAEERGLTDALMQFAHPDPTLLDVLTFSDLSVGPEGEQVEVEARIREILSRYPDGHPVHRSVSRSAPKLLAAAQRIREQLATADD